MDTLQVVSDFLAKKMGVNRAQSKELPPVVVEKLINEPRQGIIDLLSHLERKPMPDHKLQARTRELENELRSVLSRPSSAAMNEMQGGSHEKEQQLDQLIQRNEEGFLQFEDKMRESLKTTKLPDYLHEDQLFGPFEVIRANKENMDRNLIRRKNQIITVTAKESIVLQNPYYFFYDLKEGKQEGEPTDGLAGFDVIRRTMFLGENHNSSSVAHFLVQYHETKHAIHDTDSSV